MLNCKFCNKECKNDNSLRNHQRLCKENPKKQYTYFQINKVEPHKRSNQYIKAEKFGLPKPKVSEETRNLISISSSSRSKEWHIENGKKISKTINEKVSNGEWHTSLAKHMHINYKGHDLHGSWELKYAEYLDQNEIEWIKCKESFSYVFEGKQRKYTPDFYLTDKDEYIEIKGYKTEKDEAKWSQFPSYRKLTVLTRKELLDLGIKV